MPQGFIALPESGAAAPRSMTLRGSHGVLTNAPGSVLAPPGPVNWWPGDGNDVFNGTLTHFLDISATNSQGFYRVSQP
jgi:hypothetical protein